MNPPRSLLLVAFAVGPTVAEPVEPPRPLVVLAPSVLAESGNQPLPAAWRFCPQEGACSIAEPGFPEYREPAGWNGAGAFEIDIDVPGEWVGRPLALVGRLTGAARVSLAGRELGRWGQLAPYRGTTNPPPLPFMALTPGAQILRVEYVNPDVDRYRRAGWRVGFNLQMAEAGPAVAADSERVRVRSGQMWGFTAFFLGFAALHLLLARFSDERRGNLEFAVVCLGAAGLAHLLLIKELIHTPEWTYLTEPAMNVMGVLFPLAGLWWVYGLFRDHRPRRRLVVIGVAATALAIWGVVEPRGSLGVLFFAMLAAFFEMTREAATAVFRRRSGAIALALGVLALSLGFAVGLLTNLGILPRSRVLNTVVPFSSMVVLILCASFALSRRMGEYTRRSREMEEARTQQLSMLPRELPRLPGWDLAGAMDAATEVGGDYYDAALGADGELVVAIGDATGHGAKAGTLVTAMKGVFGALHRSGSGAVALQTSNEAFLRMGLRPMAMALTWVRFDSTTAHVTVAGTPPPLVVRGTTGEVHSPALGAPPLGLLKQACYAEATLAFQPGDVMVLFTDGFPEGPGAGGEPFGYDRASQRVARAVQEEGSAAAIVGSLRAAASAWRGGRTPEDDVTFFVVRRADS